MRFKSGSLWMTGFIALIALGAGSCSKSDSGTTAPPAGKELDSGNITASGGVYQHRFMTAGTFNYHCIYHAPMTGAVTVTAGTADTVNVSITSSTSPFPAAAVHVGGLVIWTNNTPAVHTVTSN